MHTMDELSFNHCGMFLFQHKNTHLQGYISAKRTVLLLFLQQGLRGEQGVLLRGSEGNFREHIFQGTFRTSVTIHNTWQLNI